VIFESLYESAKRGELLLVDGGFCHWHLRRDGQITIREIISTKPGAGSRMLKQLKLNTQAASIFAKCPIELESNNWYRKNGFILEGVETTKTGRELNCWRFLL